MEEEPEGLAQPHAPQLAADGHQMEVVHPNDVVGPQQPGQVSGEHLVHPQVALIVFAVVRREVGPVVKQGPQRAVGEAVVVFRAVLGREIDGGVGHPVDLGQPRRRRGGGREFPAPAEPQAAGLAQDRFDGYGEATGAGLGGRGITGDRDAVGDHDDSAHRTVSQLRVSRMAELISPTSE